MQLPQSQYNVGARHIDIKIQKKLATTHFHSVMALPIPEHPALATACSLSHRQTRDPLRW